MTYITNGVHMRTFLASEWYNLFDMRFDDWHDELLNEDYWERIDEIPDYQFWSVRKQLKEWLLQELHRRVVQQYRRNGEQRGDDRARHAPDLQARRRHAGDGFRAALRHLQARHAAVLRSGAARAPAERPGASHRASCSPARHTPATCRAST